MKKVVIFVLVVLSVFIFNTGYGQMSEEEKAQNCKRIYELLKDVDLEDESISPTSVLKNVGVSDQEIFAAAASFIERMQHLKNTKSNKVFSNRSVEKLSQDELQVLDAVLYNFKHIMMLLITKEKIIQICQQNRCTQNKNAEIYRDYVEIERLHHKIMKDYFARLSDHEIRVIESIINNHGQDNLRPTQQPIKLKSPKVKL